MRYDTVEGDPRIALKQLDLEALFDPGTGHTRHPQTPAGSVRAVHGITQLVLQRESFDTPAIAEEQVLACRPRCQRYFALRVPAFVQTPQTRAQLRVELEPDRAVLEGRRRRYPGIGRARPRVGPYESDPRSDAGACGEPQELTSARAFTHAWLGTANCR